MRFNITSLLLFLILLNGCSKSNGTKPIVTNQSVINQNPQVQPQNGSDTTGKPQNGNPSGQPQGGSTTVQPKLGGSINGKIGLGYYTGLILAANTVFEGKQLEYRVTVKSDASFTFLGLPESMYTITSAQGSRYLVSGKKEMQVLWGSKNDIGTLDLVPDPDNGRIIGKVIPVGAAATVFVQCIEPLNGMRFEAIPDPTTGKFELQSLPPGKWSFWFAANNGYKAPAGQAVVLSNKQIIDAGAFNFENTPPVSTLSFKTNSNSLAMDGTATYDGSTMVLSGLLRNGTYNSIGYKTYRLVINLSNITAPGTYVCDEKTTSTVTYTTGGYMSIGSTGYGTWSSQNSGASATIVVATIDPLNKTFTGTFRAFLKSTSTSKSTQEITDGKFTAIYK